VTGGDVGVTGVDDDAVNDGDVDNSGEGDEVGEEAPEVLIRSLREVERMRPARILAGDGFSLLWAATASKSMV
jgi:hypothetical protein